MYETIIDIKILRNKVIIDEEEENYEWIPTGVEYNVIGLKKNRWLGLFINDIEILRFRTNVNGERSGSEDMVPIEFHNNLIALGDFKFSIRKASYVPVSGVIAGNRVVVEDTDNEGLPNIGEHSIELRYL